MRAALVLVLALVAACDQVYAIGDTTRGTDYDNDDVVDVEDPCIAGTIDLHGDYDSDDIENVADGCPFDATSISLTDGDGDGIPDLCDPDPASGRDRLRCPMMMSNPDLDRQLWRATSGPPGWRFDRSGASYFDARLDLGRILVATSIEPSTTATYDAEGGSYYAQAQQPFSSVFRMLVRAGDEPAITDVGCELSIVASGGTSASTVTVLGSEPPASGQGQYIGDFRLHMTVAPDGHIRCKLAQAYGAGATLASAEGAVVLPPGGTFAFEANQEAYVDALVIYDQAP